MPIALVVRENKKLVVETLPVSFLVLFFKKHLFHLEIAFRCQNTVLKIY